MNTYIIRGGRSGYDRLQVLSRARRDDTLAFFERIGVRTGMTCLDLGCGSGDVVFELSRLVGPEGHVTGIDMDEVKLELAREETMSRRLSNVTFSLADVTEWSDESAYDLVYCRFLLEHLADPVDLLERMWAAVRPGGAIAVEDAEFGALFSEPENDGFEFYKRHYSLVLERRGGDPSAGRRLFHNFLRAGIHDAEVHVAQRVDSSGEAKTLAHSTLEATAEAIVHARLATRKEVDAALASLQAFTDDPATLVAEPRIFQVFSTRSELSPA